MMYAELFQYLLLYKKLPVPGIGTFLLQRKPAEGDFLEKQIKAPVYSIGFSQATDPASKHFFHWLGNALAVSDRDAVIRFNDFVFEIKKQVAAGSTIIWKGLGVLTKGLGDAIKFTPYDTAIKEEPVKAEKVIREKAEHMVRVGEDNKTSGQMTALLNQETAKRSTWWVLPLAVLVLSFIFIAWYLSQKGVDISSAANTSKLIPAENSVSPVTTP